MGMTKLIYAADFDPTVGVGAELITRQGELTKQASTIFGKEYSELKPDDRHVGIHVVALGDAEHYPMNRNGDLFPKQACVKYHDTFVKYGHVFRHHRNKDPEKSIGTIKAAAYNEPMGRIELFIHADKEKAAPELERLEKEGEIPFSMACVRAGTPVLTRFGLKPVEEISEGDIVLTHAGNWKRVSRTMKRIANNYCRVSFVSWGGRVLEITPNHSVYAVSFDDIPRGYRKDHVEHPDKGWRRRHRDELYKYLKWVPAGELTENHYMCIPAWRHGPESVGIDRARLYGYYIAEGSLCAGGTTITCNENDVFVDEIEKLADWTSVSKKPHRLSDKCVNITCFSTSIHNELESVCGRRCENKRIPESIRLGSLDEKFNFVSAWFNGDGWQDKNGMHWSIHPMNLALDLQSLLSSMGLRSSCDRIVHGENRGAVKSKNAIEYVVTISNESSGLFSDISKAKETSINSASKIRPFFSGGYLMVPVKSVEMIDEPAEVYNFSVEDDESYTVYGLAVHNCRVPNDRCFTKGTLVLTSRGFVPIEDVTVGDVAVTADASLCRVVATTVNHARSLTRVSVRGVPEEIECTPNHPFNVVSVDKMRSCSGTVGGRKRRHTPRNGAARCATCGKEIDVSAEWKRADQLVEGDYIKEKIDASSPFVTRGVSFAYLCGMYVGDGSAVWETAGHGKAGDTARIVGLSISASSAEKDAGIIENVVRAFKNCTGKEATITKEANGKKAVVVHLSDSLLANRIVSLVGMYCREKYISSEILGWSREEKAAFIAGYFDSDGSVGPRHRSFTLRICSVNKGLLLSTQRLLWSLGVPATVGIGNALENMKDADGFVHKSSSFHAYFSKVPDILVKASAKLSALGADKLSSNGGSGILLIDGYAYLPVSSSRTFECDEVSTYNFEVEGEHTYVAEGVGVHNCTICGAMRKHAGDESECEHVRDHLGEVWDDGRQVGTYNDEPQFFDISFVGRPADRIAWNLKVASALPLDSVKEAEYAGVPVPDDLACETESSRRKLGYARDIASLQSQYRGWLSKQAAVVTARDGYLYELRRVPMSSLDDETVSRIRELPTKMAFAVLADAGVVMDVPTFLKYATGDDYGKVVEPYVAEVSRYVPDYIEKAVKTGSAAKFCNRTDFDAEGYRPHVKVELYAALRKAACMDGIRESAIERAGCDACSARPLDKIAGTVSNTVVVEKLAETYAGYQMSAIDAVLTRRSGETREKLDVEAVVSAGNVAK